MKGLIVNASSDKAYTAMRIAYNRRRQDENIKNIKKKLSNLSDTKAQGYKILEMRLHVNEFYRRNDIYDIDSSSTDLVSKKEVMELLEHGKLTPDRLRELFTISL